MKIIVDMADAYAIAERNIHKDLRLDRRFSCHSLTGNAKIARQSSINRQGQSDVSNGYRMREYQDRLILAHDFATR